MVSAFQKELNSVYSEFTAALNNNILNKKYIVKAKEFLRILESGGILNPSELMQLVTSLCELHSNYNVAYYAILHLLDSHQFALISKQLEYECSKVELYQDEDFWLNHNSSMPKNRKVNKQVASFVLYLVYRKGWLQTDADIRPIMRQIVNELVNKSSKETILKLVG